MIHSSILNSKIITILVLVFILILTLFVESCYICKGVPVSYSRNHIIRILNHDIKSKLNYGLVIGDSRAVNGISPEVIMEKYSHIKIYNISLYAGNTLYALKNIIKESSLPDVIFAVISPNSLFEISQDYYSREKKPLYLYDIFRMVNPIQNPYQITEDEVNGFVKRRFRFNSGFNEFTNLIFYNDISDYTTESGWSAIRLFGSYENYSRIANEYAYKNTMFNNYNNTVLIEQVKGDLEGIIKEIRFKSINLIFIRTPVSNKIKSIENDRYPWFDDCIKSIAEKYNLQYLKYDNYYYDENRLDGSHLDKKEAVKFTELLLDSVKLD